MDLYTNNIFVDKQESFFHKLYEIFFSYLYSKTMNSNVIWLHYSTQEINIVIEELVKNNHFLFITLFKKTFFNRENYHK